jgi:hypothetical protein
VNFGCFDDLWLVFDGFIFVLMLFWVLILNNIHTKIKPSKTNHKSSKHPKFTQNHPTPTKNHPAPNKKSSQTYQASSKTSQHSSKPNPKLPKPSKKRIVFSDQKTKPKWKPIKHSNNI